MKIKKSHISIAVVIVAIIVLFTFMTRPAEKIYSMKENTVVYLQYRPQPNYQITFNSTNNSIDIYNIRFTSRNFLEFNTTIFGVLFLPHDKKNLPGIVQLPGGGETKESASHLARFIAEQGIAVLVIDQRGIGQTGGYYLPLDQDFQLFAQGKEPIQHLSVYDALAAFDVLAKQKSVDKNNIAILGESMGGRYAIIAAALEPKFKAAFIISAAGFHARYNSQFSPEANNFLYSIDPDQYVQKISPRKIVFFQSTKDTVTTLTDAQVTFDKAKDPKQLHTYENSSHGFIDQMKSDLQKELQESVKT